MITKLTDEQVMELLARRMGWKRVGECRARNRQRRHRCFNKWWSKDDGVSMVFSVPSYLTSRDAIQPVLATLTKKERQRALVHVCNGKWPALYDELWAVLDVSPRDLAHAVAAAIRGEKEGK